MIALWKNFKFIKSLLFFFITKQMFLTFMSIFIEKNQLKPFLISKNENCLLLQNFNLSKIYKISFELYVFLQFSSHKTFIYQSILNALFLFAKGSLYW